MVRKFVWLGLVAGAWVLAWMAVANYNAARERPGGRACPAGRTTLLGAIEMYSLEKNVKLLEDLPDKGIRFVPQAIVDKLVAAKMIGSAPRCPDLGPDTRFAYTSWGASLFCPAHGDMDAVNIHRPAREQLVARGVTDQEALATAWDHPAAGYESGLSARQGSMAQVAVAALVGLAARGLLLD